MLLVWSIPAPPLSIPSMRPQHTYTHSPYAKECKDEGRKAPHKYKDIHEPFTLFCKAALSVRYINSSKDKDLCLSLSP